METYHHIAGMAARATRCACAGMAVVVLIGVACAAPSAGRAPSIRHKPVKVAAPGQAISLRAVVTSEDSALASVNLYYTPSADVAPFKVPMYDAGGGSYIGTIDAALLVGLAQVSYYMEAVDERGESTETAWYAVRIGGTTREGNDVASSDQRRSWKKPALIGAGIAALAGGTALALGGGSGGGGAGGGTNTTVYAGSVTVGLQVSGSAAEYETYAITLNVTASGRINSSTLRPDAYMEAVLVQNDFLLTSPVNDADGTTGEIQFAGTIVDERISGSVRGSVTTGDGKSGFYVGTFSATQQ